MHEHVSTFHTEDPQEGRRNRIRHDTTTHGILTAAAESGMYYLASWQDGLSKAMVSGSLQPSRTGKFAFYAAKK
jgi:hypothetical protein